MLKKVMLQGVLFAFVATTFVVAEDEEKEFKANPLPKGAEPILTFDANFGDKDPNKPQYVIGTYLAEGGKIVVYRIEIKKLTKEQFEKQIGKKDSKTLKTKKLTDNERANLSIAPGWGPRYGDLGIVYRVFPGPALRECVARAYRFQYAQIQQVGRGAWQCWGFGPVGVPYPWPTPVIPFGAVPTGNR